MAKKLSLVLLLSSLSILSACGAVKESGPVDTILLGQDSVSFVLGNGNSNTFQITSRTKPRTDKEVYLKYTSLNEDICKVSDTGLITAKKSGKTQVVVSSQDDKVSSVIDVHVLDSISKSAASKRGNEILNAQKQPTFTGGDTFEVTEKLYETITIDGVIHNVNDWDEKYVISKSQAFLRVGGYNFDIKCEGGSVGDSYYEWVFYTNESFDTYAFHSQNGVNNYLRIDTTEFISKGGTRFDALCEVLDNIFTGGKRIITDQINHMLGMNGTKSLLASAASGENQGSNDAGDLFFRVVDEETEFTADYDDEDDFNIPVGTKYLYNDHVDLLFTDNYCSEYYVGYTLKYENNGSNYIDDTSVKYHYKEITDLPYPDKTMYSEVADIYEL